MLRGSDGFAEFCRRLRQRNLRATFYEVFAARILSEAQYKIHAQPETYTKGQDYDFCALKDGQQINIEVTTLAEKQFSSKTIPNSLHKKQKQLPKDLPAIIFVGLPTQWIAEPQDWDTYLMQVSHDFFRGSQRINAVVFIEERFLQIGIFGSIFLMIQKPYVHPQPRTKIEDMSFLTMNSIQIRLVRDSEFFRWIDHVVPKTETANEPRTK